MTDKTPEQYAAEVDNDWSQFVAQGPIFIEGVRAFNEGNPVPASHVKTFDLEKGGYVKRVASAKKSGPASAPDSPAVTGTEK